VARGMDSRQILVVDLDGERLEDAAEDGHVGLRGDARSEQVLLESMLPKARVLFVCTDRDDTNVLIVLTARHLSPNVRIVARVEEAENEKLVRQSGANATVLPSRVGGILMADSLESSALPAYVMDLISADGSVTLVEREARAQDVGRRPAELNDGLVVRVVRGTRTYGFWDRETLVQEGDRLTIIVPAAGA
jgi:voltage-gated potassium channel